MKTFFIKICEDFELNKEQSIWIMLLIKLTFKNDKFNGKLLGWSNEKQKYIEVNESFYKEYKQIQTHYQYVLGKYINFLNKNIVAKAFCEKFFKDLKNPPINYQIIILI